MSEHIHHVTDDTFEPEVLQSQVPVLVDYWAEWCGPCKMIAPILDEVATEYSGRLKIAKLNIDENQGTPPKYGIRGIPTLMLHTGLHADYHRPSDVIEKVEFELGPAKVSAQNLQRVDLERFARAVRN